MANSRPVWKGQLRLSLVSIPVEMHSAAKSGATISFRQIHEPTKKPVHYQKVVEGVGPIDTDEIMKGFEYEKGDYVLLTSEEIDEVKLDSKKTLELTQFVGACEIDPIYFDKPYFLVPTDELAEDAFRVVRDALRQTEKIGLGQLALRGKEYLVAVKPCGSGLLLETLHYEAEIRKADAYFSQISTKKADAELLDVATALIDKKTAKFDAGTFKNHYTAALRALIDRKLKSKGRKVTAQEEEPAGRSEGGNVVDLMSALKKSLEKSEGGKAKSTKSKKASSGKKSSSRKKAS